MEFKGEIQVEAPREAVYEKIRDARFFVCFACFWLTASRARACRSCPGIDSIDRSKTTLSVLTGPY